MLEWLVATAVAAGAPAEPIVVDGHELNQVIDCRGRMVRVTGHLNWLTLQGTCPVVSVSGVENRVCIEAVERLHLSGCDNAVAWKRSLKGDAPEIDQQSCPNRVSHAPTSCVGATKDPRPAKSEAEVKADAKAAELRSFGAQFRIGPRWEPPGPPGPGINFYPGGVQEEKDCTGKDVTIWGSDNELSYGGACGAVTVKGSHNTVHLESAAAIDVPGADNAVTYRSGKPKVTVAGKGSTATRVSKQ